MRIQSAYIFVQNLGRDLWIGRALLAALWAGGVLYYATANDAGGMTMCGVPLLLLVGTSLLVGLNHGRSVAGTRARGARGHVWFDGDEVEVAAGRALHRWKRADIVSGWSEGSGAGVVVVLGWRSGVFVSLGLPPDARARDVLQAAGITPDQRAAVIRMGVHEPGLARAVMIFLSLILGILLVVLVPVIVWMFASSMGGSDVSWTTPAVVTFFTFVGVFVCYQGLLRPLIPSTVRIGTDGVLIERFFRKRLLRRGEVDRVLAIDRHVELWREGKSVASVPASGPDEAQVVANAISDALAEPIADGASPLLVEKLDRGGRPLEVWLQDLRVFGKASAGYREAAGSPRDLLDIARSGAAPAGRRIAAAAVLAGQGDPQMRVELRAAAETCADPRLRVALRKAAEGEIAEEDLAQIEAEAEAQARRG